MARIVGGKIRGKVGNVVYSEWNGIEVLKAVPQRSKNSWTDKQIMHRQRFKAIREYCRRYKFTLIPQIWNLAAENGHGSNLFLKANTPAFALDGQLTAIDKLHFSAGNLPFPQQITASRLESDPSKVQASWVNDENLSSAYSRDELMMVAAIDDRFTNPIATGIMRKSSGGIIDLPENPENIKGIWLFFRSYKKDGYSDDQYYGI